MKTYPPIPMTEKLTALLNENAGISKRIEHERAASERLTQILNPQYQNETVRRVSDVNDDDSRKSGVVTTGVDLQEALNSEDELKRVRAGEPLARSANTQSELDAIHRQWAALVVPI